MTNEEDVRETFTPDDMEIIYRVLCQSKQEDEIKVAKKVERLIFKMREHFALAAGELRVQ